MGTVVLCHACGVVFWADDPLVDMRDHGLEAHLDVFTEVVLTDVFQRPAMLGVGS